MADGSVIINTKLDNAPLQRDLNKVKAQIIKLEADLSSSDAAKSPLLEKAHELEAQLKEINAQAREYHDQWLAGVPGADSKETAVLDKTIAIKREYAGICAELDKAESKSAKINGNLEAQKAVASTIEEKMAATSASTTKMGASVKVANTSMDTFQKRLGAVVRSALIFTVITQALAKFRNWMGDVIQSNAEASAAVGRLQGALLTMVQPLVSVVIPALVTFVNILTRIATAIASVMAALFGSTISQSQAAAKSLSKETSALNATGKAAKKASGNLAAFDALNVLQTDDSSSGSGGAISPAFNFDTSHVNDDLNAILRTVMLIGAALLALKFGKGFIDILSKFAGFLLAIGGAIVFVQGAWDAWQNGVNWDNLGEMALGVTALVVGLCVALGPVAAAIGAIVGGVAMLIVAIHDIMENGLNLQNMLLAIAGLLAAGLGISILVGSWIPLIIAAVAAVLLALVTFTGHGSDLINSFKQICKGFMDFFTGIFTGDWKKAWGGLVDIGKGAVNLIITILNSLISAAVAGLNAVIGLLNKLSFDVPDWVPALGGKTFGFNIGSVTAPQIPYLAQGAVIPPNSKFLAMLGDQKSGTNIEAPLDTIKQAVAEVLGDTNETTPIVLDVTAQLDGEVIWQNQRKIEVRKGRQISLNPNFA